MKTYFDIPFEFDHENLEKTIKKASKGYCCFIDSNLLVESFSNDRESIKEVFNNSLINSCDGSYIALLASFIHGKKLKAYNGPKLFNKFIYQNDKHCIVGNTARVFDSIKLKVERLNGDSDIHYISLPFVDVDSFNYREIGNQINALKPRYIWVSLGAPKQETFMYKLLPYLDVGVMLGVGAALNYFSGEIKDIPKWAINLKLIWFYRIITEPGKQIKRVLKILRHYPQIYATEKNLLFNAKKKH